MPGPTLALITGVCVLAAVGALAIAFSPKPEKGSTSSPVAVDARLVTAIVVGLVVLATTRWPIAAVAAALLVLSWRWLAVSDLQSRTDRARLESIAKWLEDLRDVVRRSSVSLEDALEMVSERPSRWLSEPLERFVLRRRQGTRLADALVELADALAHPTADAAIASMLLVVDGGAGGGRLHDTLDELASAARNEVAARVEVDRTRRVYQRSMQRLVLLTVAFIGLLVVFSPDLVAPYRTVKGQIWLVIPVGVWAACLVWLRRLMRYEAGTRYRLRVSEAIV